MGPTRTVAIAATAALAFTVGPGTRTADAVDVSGIVIGASGEYDALKSRTAPALEQHRYGMLNGPAITDVAFVNIEPSVDWSVVANGGQDTNLRRWADAMDNVGTRMVSFSHEPMVHLSLGGPAQFIAAWRHVVTVFNQRGATNVRWVWNVTSHSFRGPNPTGQQWYPGDSWVDYISGEAYNRYQCGTPTNNSMAERIQEIFAFAGQRGKRFVVGEFASNKFAGRADWLRAATRFMAERRSRFAGAFYYHSRGQGSRGSCSWRLDTAAEYDAMRAMVNTL